MYCSKCGNLLNENGTCSNCDVASTHVTAANPVSSTGTVSQKTSLAKCAWFAPVSPILWYIIKSFIIRIFDTFIFDFYDDISRTYESGYFILMGIMSALIVVIQWIISLILFKIAFLKINKDIRNKVFLIFTIPNILLVFVSAFSNLVQQILTGLYVEPISLDIDMVNIGVVGEIVFVVGLLLTSIISYFLCSNYLSKFDLSEEIKSEEKIVVDSAASVGNYPQQENNFYTQQNIQTQKSEKSRGVAAVLCFFLGALGIHRFYVGKIGTGLLWMFTAGLFGIGAFIDFIIIICGSFKDADDRTL